jgi:hypothetical protein
MLKQELASMLAFSRRRVGDGVEAAGARPEIGTLLEVDAQYRKGAAQNALPTIAPRRFNPRRERWLPILHAEADGWTFTALFSNTAHAHQQRATHDWVVLFFEKEGREGQCTVVTELHGPLAAMRVVRGREAECGAWHRRRVSGGAPVAS